MLHHNKKSEEESEVLLTRDQVSRLSVIFERKKDRDREREREKDRKKERKAKTTNIARLSCFKSSGLVNNYEQVGQQTDESIVDRSIISKSKIFSTLFVFRSFIH